ncbi:MAG: hypothetical protein GY828_01830 [Candidatus Gracilibacteria bacterium]|nr:hypothetical protein [Candidatus Gracilibacteria bacterium]
MKNIKKIIILSLLIFTLTSCGNKESNETEQKNTTENQSGTTEENKAEEDISFEEVNQEKEEKTLTSTGTNSEVITTQNLVSENTKETEKVTPEKVIVEKKHTTENEVILKDVIAHMQTSKGLIKIELYTDVAPLATTNFIVHAQNGYYDNVTFHRIIDNFMIQGGDPEGTGRGGESIYGENFEDEFFDKIENLPGTISMANAGPGTNGSQFFINDNNNSFLNGKHTVFGKVIEGIDVVENISKTPLNGEAPVEDILITSISLFKNNKAFSIENIESVKTNAHSKYKILQQKVVEKELVIAEKALKEFNIRAEKNKDKIAAAGDRVEVKYELTLDDGKVIDGNMKNNSYLAFTIDNQEMIQGFNDALKGMKIGDTKKITLSPEDAYGKETIEAKLQDFKQLIDNGIAIKAGEQIQYGHGVIDIISVENEVVTIKNPHQLGGETLHFEIKLANFNN